MNSEFVLTMGHDQLWVNTACIKAFPDKSSAQLFIDPVGLKLYLVPCRDNSQNSVRWISGGKSHGPKHITCHLLFIKFMLLFNLAPDTLTKFKGSLQEANGIRFLEFDLQIGFPKEDDAAEEDSVNEVTYKDSQENIPLQSKTSTTLTQIITIPNLIQTAAYVFQIIKLKNNCYAFLKQRKMTIRQEAGITYA